MSEIEGELLHEEDNLPAVRASNAIVVRDEISVDELVAQSQKVKEAMKQAMVPEVHYGHIPGVKKPTLLKPGAETLLVLLRLAPYYDSEKIFHDDGHLTVFSKATLKHIPSGLTIAEGEGMCTSRESKYGQRKASRKCPQCDAEAIIKGKDEYGGGWVCFKKKGGCGAKFEDNDPAITEQESGTTVNPDLPDTFNTVLKMSNKRALIAAVLNGTAASDIFTQDVEDQPRAEEPAAPKADPKPEEKRDAPGLDVPRNWGAIAELVGPYGAGLDWKVWTRQASEHLYNEPDSSKLTAAQRKEMLKISAGAIHALVLAHPAGEFPPPERQEVAEAWAAQLGGIMLAGPEKRLDPTEVERPLSDEEETLALLDEMVTGPPKS